MATKAKSTPKPKTQATTIRPAIMTFSEAAAALRISIPTLRYHILQGRIRRVTIPGAKRSLGVYAADIRAILTPTANGGSR